MFRQRLRGILRTAIATAIPWTIFGGIVGIVFRYNLIPYADIQVQTTMPIGLVGSCMLAGMFIGAVNGVTLAVFVLAGERGKKIEELRPWRFAAWGALATAATLGAFFQNATVAGIGGAVGGLAAIATLAIARRAQSSESADPAFSGL